MALRYTALLLIIVLLAASVSAQESICDFFHVPPLQCEICGYTPSAPVYCIAYNATFDDLPPDAPVPIYGNVQWSNFSVLASPNTTTPSAATVTPYSPPNFAAVPAGDAGIMTFGFNGGVDSGHDDQYPIGTLHYFHYACSLPSSSPPVPAPCTLTVTGTCLTNNASFLTGPTAPVTATYAYVPQANGNMAFEGADFGTITTAEVGSQRCLNYTFVADAGEGIGDGVQLLLDDVIYNTFTEGYTG